MDEKTIYQGPIFSLIKTGMLLNGKEVERDVIRHVGGAAVVALKDSQILLVRQHRAGSGEVMIEIPAGMIDPGETPEQTAMRELIEETGYVSDPLEKLCSFYPTPGYDSEKLHVYLGQNARAARNRLAPDENEEIHLFWMDFDKALEMVLNGEIDDAKTIIGILLTERKRTKR